MTREQFIKLTGEDPADVLGEDWEEFIDEYVNGDNEDFHDGHKAGSCFACKQD